MSSAISYTWTLASELSGCRIVMTCNPRYNCCSVSQHVDIGSKASDSILVPSGDAQGCSSIKRCRSCHWQFLLDVLLVCYIDCKHSECKKITGFDFSWTIWQKDSPTSAVCVWLKGTKWQEHTEGKWLIQQLYWFPHFTPVHSQLFQWMKLHWLELQKLQWPPIYTTYR